ncbi:MAG: sulfite exporter TauE/SafE family protein [Candidatus Nanopelagicales bacterium]
MIVLAAFLSVFIGGAVGLLGGGGSILTTPLLVYVLDFTPKEAITASLFIVAVTSLFGLINHARGGRVQWRTGLIFGGAGMTGAFIGGQVGSHLPGALLLGAFSVMMGVTAVAMLRGRRTVEGSHHKGLPVFRIILDGLVVGLVTGLVGAGGGFLVVPALALLGGLPMPIAVATSLLVVAMKSFAGFAGYALQFGDGSFVSLNPETEINWGLTLIITAGAIIGALIGSRMVGKIHPDKLRKGFGWFVLVMAVFILSQQIGGAVIEFAESGTLQLLEVILGVGIVVAFFTWVIRRPAKTPAIADYDEPEAITKK